MHSCPSCCLPLLTTQRLSHSLSLCRFVTDTHAHRRTHVCSRAATPARLRTASCTATRQRQPSTLTAAVHVVFVGRVGVGTSYSFLADLCGPVVRGPHRVGASSLRSSSTTPRPQSSAHVGVFRATQEQRRKHTHTHVPNTHAKVHSKRRGRKQLVREKVCDATTARCPCACACMCMSGGWGEV